MNHITYLLCLVLFLIGLYCVLVKKNLIKIIIGFGIMDYAVNLFLVLIGYKKGGQAPIFSPGEDILEKARSFVDPVPQALVLTSIVIGLAVTALMVGLAMRLYEKYGTFDITKIRKLKG